jgi:uncharacterized protein (DUF1015 family)
MRIHAFQGFRFTAATGDAGAQAAPPFDQIDDAQRDQLQSLSPWHFAHFTRPLDGPEGNPYEHAAAVHRQWIESGAVARDEAPALYPYQIEMPGGGERLGLCALIGVEAAGSNVIRPHESTLDKPFADRLNLLRTTRIDPEPVMFLSDDPGTLEGLLRADVAAASPLVEHRDGAGNLHRLFTVSDPRRIRAYQEALTPCSAAIADGHHRYKVGRTYAEEIQAQPGTAAAAKMAVLFSLASDWTIDPIHRGFAQRVETAALHSLIRDRQPLAATDGRGLAAAVAAAPQPALAVRHHDGVTELWQLDPARMPSGSPPGTEDLAVAHLHWVLLPKLGFTPQTYLDGTVTYRANPQNLFEQVNRGELATGIWLPPMGTESFGQAISKGDLLPAKATRFLPKVASGLVWAGHDARLL